MKRYLPVFLLSAMLAVPALSPAAEDGRTLAVRGSATIDAAPDTSIVTVAVETMAPGARDSAALNARASENVLSAVKRALGPADELVTASYSVFPVYEYHKDRVEVLKGYRTVHQIKATSGRPASAGEVLDRAMEAGANKVVEVRFDIKDVSAHCEGLIKTAASRALQQARAAAGAFGAALDGVKTIVPACVKDTDGPARPFGAEMMKLRAADTPIEAGSVRLRADVEAVYFLRDEKRP